MPTHNFVDNEKMEVRIMPKNKQKFECNEWSLDKADAVLSEMLSEEKARLPKHPVAALIRQKIAQIDELSAEGASLIEIYGRLNSALLLGISLSSFVQYVRGIRRETGSKMYVSRKKKMRETEEKQDKFLTKSEP